MEQLILIFFWLVATLFIAAFSILIGKRHGVAYPIAIMASLIVIANVLAPKVVVLGPLTVTAGILVYSSTFLITDLISEVWNREEARRAVWAGFYGSVAFVISVWIALSWPAAPFAIEMSDNFAAVLGLAPRIVLGSMLGYLASQHLDVTIYHFLKERMNGRHLWVRNNASTIVSQLVDSIIFMTVAFYGILPLVPLIIGTWLVKVIIALVDTPFAYLIRHLARRV